ncbi:2-carboxy-1,4-naphthoquinone phytyltransferase, chloroplastic [Iris pallida]|uniref:2-carboxy-1,4-naphthoquinone phytyltransferase, chloroplastic n=1 Tax=Iris pallida TaxID=29817 RepID=A0AAX6DN29_IRIPA|nr:2-carboxy-1,4-naphthoquinone phytyltransferase, chloroplastic [Iris pallida]
MFPLPPPSSSSVLLSLPTSPPLLLLPAASSITPPPSPLRFRRWRRRLPPAAPPRCSPDPSPKGTRAAAAAAAAPAPSSASSGCNGKAEELSRWTLLWRAAKLPIYSVALVPLTVGCAAAYLHTGIFFASRYCVLLFASILIITWLNLSNDVYDFDTGVDQDKKESVVNIVGSRSVVHFAANTSLVLGFMGLIWALAEAGDLRFFLLVTFSVLCGYIYQCPPFRLSYQGLGEPLCFSAFGPFATTAFYFSQRNNNLLSGLSPTPLTGTILSASVLVGLTTTLILFCSHFHQIEGDREVGKMSPLVRIGTKSGSEVVKYGVWMLYVLVTVFSIFKALPVTCTVLCLMTLPLGKLVVDFVVENHNDKIKIFMAKYYCVRLHALFGAALAIGLLLSRDAPTTLLPRFSWPNFS